MGISMSPLKGQPFIRLNENLKRHHFNQYDYKDSVIHLVASCKPDQVPVSLEKSVYCTELEIKDFTTLPTGLKEVEDDLEYSDYKRPFYGSLKKLQLS